VLVIYDFYCTYHPRFDFIAKTGKAFSKRGDLFLLWSRSGSDWWEKGNSNVIKKIPAVLDRM